MTFLNPVMLVGLAAALVPLVLHLLNRSRYRNVDWAAMMFLDGMQSRQHHSARFKQWALLGARMLVIALLAGAIARPLLHVRGLPPARPGRTAAVILLDRSASMAFNDNGRLRLDLAREAVFQLLSPAMHRGDDLWLIPLGDRPPASEPRYATDPEEMAKQVREIATASGSSDVAAGLRHALDLLATAEAPNQEVYLVCDRQASSWRGVDDAFVREWRQRVAALRRAPRLFVLPVGTDDFDNIAIESIEPVREPFVARQPGEIEVRIHNYGTVPRSAQQLAVTMRPRSAPNVDVGVKATTVNLPAGVTTSVVIPVTFNDPGSNLIEAHISSPGLPHDKELMLPVDVLPRIGLLAIDGDEREGGFRTASDFLKLALQPFPVAVRNTAVVSVARPELWSPLDLTDQQVVFLANVPSFTESQARALQQFVYGGGGLIVAPGDQSRVDAYNALLPWLPAALQPPTAETEAGATAVGNLELAHPAFRFLRGRQEASPAVVRRYFPVTPRGGAAVIASYADGRPFALDAPVGRGRVLLITTPIDTDWNTLPLTSFFLPFVQSAVRYVAAANLPRRVLLPGEPIVANIDEPIDPRYVKTLRGGVRLDPAAVIVSQFGTHAQLRITDTFVPDLYRILPRGDGDPRMLQFVVRTSPEESDLTPLAERQWENYQRDLGFDRIDPERRAITAEQDAFRTGWDLWVPLLGGAMVLSLLELAATRHWRGREE